ncbi:MAG: HlyD family efflux transporter periplasmic adaptor subunit, partial [Steroidobacteraceae bacterium]|nr:HlyD family efflux transporter periplasmic adaptor subunit [Steroidobacteraceae bacterium]MDW8258705.1 HlyD family efflux transporter periplasmic adaptor subunit [Gammaproteobacteria bacterium]
MAEPLFRSAALAARRQQWLGGVSIVQPPAARWLVGIVGIAVLGIALLLANASYTRRARATGQLVPSAGLVLVVAPVSGVVTRVAAGEGVQVDSGAELVAISTTRHLAYGPNTAAELNEALDRRERTLRLAAQSDAAQLAERARSLRSQLQAAQQELAALHAERSTRAQQIALTAELLERHRRLAEQRLASDIELRQRQQQYLDMVGAEQALARQEAALRRSLGALRQALDELPAQRVARELALERELSSLAEERLQVAASAGALVRAPVAGLVAVRYVEPGQAVGIGDVLLALLPAGAQLQAQLFVPSRGIGFVAVGDRVLLRYLAFPYQKFGHQVGYVRQLSRSALDTREVARWLAGTPQGDTWYRVLVQLQSQRILVYGRGEPLRPGMLVEADILGEKRKLYEWLLEPLYSLRRLDG